MIKFHLGRGLVDMNVETMYIEGRIFSPVYIKVIASNTTMEFI